MHWSRCFVSYWYTTIFPQPIKGHFHQKTLVKHQRFSMGCVERVFAAVIRVSGSSQLGNCSGLWVLVSHIQSVSEITFLRNRNWAKVVEGRKEAEKRERHCWHDRERELQQTVVLYNIWMNVLYNIVAFIEKHLPSVLMRRTWEIYLHEITGWDIILSWHALSQKKKIMIFVRQ